MNEENVNVNVKGKTGRPKAVITWFDDSFTVQSLARKLNLSKATVYAKVHEAIAAGEVVQVGSESFSRGRKSIMYRKVQRPASLPVPNTP